MNTNCEQRSRWRGAGIMALTTVLLSGVSACDGLLDVRIPGAVTESDLDNPALATTLSKSALGSFDCAFVNYAATVGVHTEEYIVSAGWLNSNIWGWRGIELNSTPGSCSNARDNSGFGAFTPLQEARFLTEDAARRLEAFDGNAVPNRGPMVAELKAHAGYAYTLLGEGFCEMAVNQGPLLQPSTVLQRAETFFTEVIDDPQAAADIRLLARAGRARVRLNLGNGSGAASDAAQIPSGWEYRINYSGIQGTRENRVYNVTIRNAFLSVAPAYRDLRVGGEPDSRVPVIDRGRAGHDGLTPQWEQRKYTSASSSVRLASWVESKLILAEVSGGSEAIQHINEVRSSKGIPPLNNPDPNNMLPTILEERRREFFSEGHRLNDMLRHGIPFPQGTNHKGQTYGNTTCLPLPDQERNANPNL